MARIEIFGEARMASELQEFKAIQVSPPGLFVTGALVSHTCTRLDYALGMEERCSGGVLSDPFFSSVQAHGHG